MRKNRYLVYFGERRWIENGFEHVRQIAEICDAYSKSEVRRRMRVKARQIVFMRSLGY